MLWLQIGLGAESLHTGQVMTLISALKRDLTQRLLDSASLFFDVECILKPRRLAARDTKFMFLSEFGLPVYQDVALAPAGAALERGKMAFSLLRCCHALLRPGEALALWWNDWTSLDLPARAIDGTPERSNKCNVVALLQMLLWWGCRLSYPPPLDFHISLKRGHSRGRFGSKLGAWSFSVV